MLESVRARLTLWYVSILAVVLVAFSVIVYGLLARSLEARVDDGLRAILDVARTSLAHDTAEGQDARDAANSTVTELSTGRERLAVLDAGGRLLSEKRTGLPGGLRLPLAELANDEVRLFDVREEAGDDDVHRVALTRVRVPPDGVVFLIAASQDLDAMDDELEAMRDILVRAVPIALIVAAVGGWFMARKSLSPVAGMADQARRMGADLSGRLAVSNPRDELGRLAGAINELLDRLADSFAQQRRFMADASHEIRTPLAAIRAASSVTLQRSQRSELEYRGALHMIGTQTRRIGRLVEDMFMLARADSGHYPVRRERFYLDELLADAGRAGELLAATRSVSVAVEASDECPFDGDEDLITRMVRNLVDNAMRHARPDTTVKLSLECRSAVYRIEISDEGPGIPVEAQSHIFDRFFRADPSRGRGDVRSGEGAGLGLAIARWAAEAHGGRLELVRSGPSGTVFAATLPHP